MSQNFNFIFSKDQIAKYLGIMHNVNFKNYISPPALCFAFFKVPLMPCCRNINRRLVIPGRILSVIIIVSITIVDITITFPINKRSGRSALSALQNTC